MKKVMIHAYTNYNLGDDLFIKVLCERYPHVEFIILSPKGYDITFKDIPNLKVISRTNLFVRGVNFLCRIFNKDFSYLHYLVKKCDATVNIGGSIFIERSNWKRKFERRKSLNKYSGPYFVIGSNFGPFQEEEYYLKHKGLFKEYTDICFREKYSFNLFKDLPNVRMADDVIFQLDNKYTGEYESNTIVISVIKPSIREHLISFDDIYYQKIKEILMYFVEKGNSVTLMSFCEKERDNEAVLNIKRMIPDSYLPNVNSYFYKNNIDEALEIIAKSKFVIGTRFHAMILGWVYGKPVFPIAYSEKMTNVMKDINYQGTYTDLKNIHKLNPKDVFNSMETNNIDISNQIWNSEKQFEKLDEYLLK